MKGVKAVFETMISGPVRVRVLGIYSTYNGLPLEVLCRVTSKTSRPWTKGLLFITTPMFLWERHRYVGKLRCNSLYQGRPNLNGLPEATPELLKQLEEQS